MFKAIAEVVMTAHGRPASIKNGATPTKERHHRNGGVYSEVIDRDANGKVFMRRYRARWERPFDLYREMNLITEAQYRAGIKFHRVFYSAVMCRKAEYKPVSESHPLLEQTMSDKLLKKAYDVVDSDDIDTVVEVCGFGGRIWNPAAYEKLRK